MKKGCYLRSLDSIIAGGFMFAERMPDGSIHKFPSTPIFEHIAKDLSDFRTRNGLPRAGEKESAEDVSRYACARLGNPPTLCACVDAEGKAFVALNQSSPIIAGRCGGCGAPV